MTNYRGYDDALRSRDPRIWMGCKGTGRCRPCGAIHDFRRRIHDTKGVKYEADFRCLRNDARGCPDPQPEPEHDFGHAGYCRTCKIRRRKTERRRGQ